MLPKGRRFAIWRNFRGVSQKTIADAIGITIGAVSHWEHGRGNPKDGRLETAVDLLGLTMAEFYGELPIPTKADKGGTPKTTKPPRE